MRLYLRFFLTIVLVMLWCVSFVAKAESPCALNLVYKDKGKAGYMAKAPSNEGLYKALYTELAGEMGCELVIKRYPKKRTLLLVEHGEADLYPSTGFNKARSDFMFYIPNGLYRYEPYYGLTPLHVQELGSISHIARHGLVWIFEAGNTTLSTAEELGVATQQVVGLTDARAISMLEKGRSVFYRIIKGDYERYLESRKLDNLRELNIETHKTCCEPKSQQLYLGFSRKSKYYQEEPNPEYNDDKEVSASNFPTRVVKGSLPYKLSMVLSRLEKSGRVHQLFSTYILDAGHTP